MDFTIFSPFSQYSARSRAMCDIPAIQIERQRFLQNGEACYIRVEFGKDQPFPIQIRHQHIVKEVIRKVGVEFAAMTGRKYDPIEKYMMDAAEKAHEAIYTHGPAFLNVMALRPRGWRYSSEKMTEVTKAAVEPCV